MSQIVRRESIRRRKRIRELIPYALVARRFPAALRRIPADSRRIPGDSRRGARVIFTWPYFSPILGALNHESAKLDHDGLSQSVYRWIGVVIGVMGSYFWWVGNLQHCGHGTLDKILLGIKLKNYVTRPSGSSAPSEALPLSSVALPVPTAAS